MYDILACVHASVQIIVILGDSTPKGAKTSWGKPSGLTNFTGPFTQVHGDSGDPWDSKLPTFLIANPWVKHNISF